MQVRACQAPTKLDQACSEGKLKAEDEDLQTTLCPLSSSTVFFSLLSRSAALRVHYREVVQVKAGKIPSDD